MTEDLLQLLRAYALQNAVRHGDAPKAGAIVGAVMGKHPELRSRAKEVSALVRQVIEEVTALSPEARLKTLEEIAPELLVVPEKQVTHKGELPPLRNAEGGVVMRFAPNPSGPLHLGHARAAMLNDAYLKRYGGRYILRIEDTDPKRVDPEAYRMVQEDIAWMNLGITEIVYQSDRFDQYYQYAEKLIDLGGAYVCTCDNDRFRELRQAKKPCPCRGHTVEENLKLWEQMLGGVFAEGEVSLRVKADLAHPDPAMRDYPIFRVLTSTLHPRIEATVYPLMNFTVAVDDHLLGITHVIRGKDHIANTGRQRYIFDFFGWTVPEYIHYGRMGIEGVVLSTSEMHAGIDAGTYAGWDDIRLGTLRALARRGITPEAVRHAMVAIGTGDTDISFSWENLYAENRAVIDHDADRYFFVPSPVVLPVSGAPATVAEAALYPNDPARGTRSLAFNGTVVLPAAEIRSEVAMLRLKDLFNVSLSFEDGVPHLAYAGDDLAEARAAKAPIVQWLPAEAKVPCLLHQQQGDLSGYCEPGVRQKQGAVIQFERVGFVRIDAVTPAGITAYFAHR